MTYVRPSWWLPSLEVIWGVITGLVAMTTSVKQVYILRVFLGLCESAAYPGMITLFSTFSRDTQRHYATRASELTTGSVLVHATGNGQEDRLLPFLPGTWADDVGGDAGVHCENHGWSLRPCRVEVSIFRHHQCLMAHISCRWLFVINAIITVIWGLAGYFMIPDSPGSPNPWAFWFKRVHSEYALHRLERENRLDAKPITWAAAKYVPFIAFKTYGS